MSYSYSYSFQLANRKTDKKALPFSEAPVIIICENENNSVYYAYLSWEDTSNTIRVGNYNHDLCSMNLDKSFHSILTKYIKKEIVQDMLEQMYQELSAFENMMDNGEIKKLELNFEQSYSLLVQDYKDKKITKIEMKKRYNLLDELETNWNNSR